jgi:hypothetical protein
MQERRHRPGDVLDDYCPRERRITDHAIVAMIDDEIRRTRCGICDAEHEYKEGKVPAPRRKTQPPALFTQVLDNLNGSTPKPPPSASASAVEDVESEIAEAMTIVDAPERHPIMSTPPAPAPVPAPAALAVAVAPALEPAVAPGLAVDEPEEPELAGGFRRSLIRATFPRPEGQAPPPRAVPEFTIQSLQNRRNNNQRNAGGGGQNKFRGGRRRPGGAGGMQDNIGPMRFRDHGSQQGQGQDGRPQGQGNANGGGGGRRRRGGKKNR